MKPFYKAFLFVLMLGLLAPHTLANTEHFYPRAGNNDSTEKVRVIKVDKDNFDVIVERASGERWLIQHHSACQTMSTEFPVDLIWENGKVKELKVDFNEICKVYNAGLFTAQGKLSELRIVPGTFGREKELDIVVDYHKYTVRYTKGCEYLYEFEGESAYLNMNEGSINGATLILPNHRGSCEIKQATLKETYEKVENPNPPLKHVTFLEGVNRVSFSWEDPAPELNRKYLISYSRYPIEPKNFDWHEMPNLEYSEANEYTVLRLDNDKLYHFYLAAVDPENNVSDWTYITATPYHLVTYKYDYSVYRFEAELVEETDEYFHLRWEDREDAARYLVKFYIDGKEVLFKFIEENEIKIQKTQSYPEGTKFKFNVTSIPNNRLARRYRATEYWIAGKYRDGNLWRNVSDDKWWIDR